MKEMEDHVSKVEWLIFTIIMVLLIVTKTVKACETVTIHKPDGSIQVCQVCDNQVFCY